MGFRDLNTFNLVLLGKQAWRLIHEPNSYWAKFIKARYFPNCDFINAVAGHRHRIVWPWNKSGLYSVKSGYNLQVVSVSSIRGNNRSPHVIERGVWKDIWATPTFPKIKFFL